MCITHYYISISKKVFPHASYFLDTIFCYVFVKKEKIVQPIYNYLRAYKYSYLFLFCTYISVLTCVTLSLLSAAQLVLKNSYKTFFLQKAQKSWTAAHSCLKMEEISRSIKNERYFKSKTKIRLFAIMRMYLMLAWSLKILPNLWLSRYVLRYLYK